jgi:hypothetical protein
MKDFYGLLIVLLLSVGQIESVKAAPASQSGAQSRFPKPVEEYHDEEIPGIAAKLVHRVQPEMIALLKEIRHNPLLWLLAFVPVVFIAGKARPEDIHCSFCCRSSRSCQTGDAVGGLLNATLGNLTELLIATLSAWLVTNSGRSAWFVGVLVLMVYLIFALTLYLLPPGAR